MGVSEPKYAGVSSLDAEGGIPIATAIDNNSISQLASAKVDNKGQGQHNNEEDHDGITITWEKGEVQPSEYRDKWFAVAFIAHLFAVVGTGIAYGPTAFNDNSITHDTNNVDTDDYAYGGSASDKMDESLVAPKEFWIVVVTISLLVAPALSLVALSIMSRNAIGLIKCSLWFSIVLCGVSALIFMAVSPFIGIFYAIFTVCLIWYARRVQNRIPYAASNLKVAITVLRTNLGLGLVSIASMMALIGYCSGWVFAFGGTMQLDVMKDDSSSESYSYDGSSSDQSDLSALGGVVGFLFILSFYWTQQVIQNVVRATVSGVVGTWWFSPSEASSFCSNAVNHSLIRSTTYSLGSICFGSLIVAILHMLRNCLRRAQNDRNGGILRCIALCILSYIEALVEYFNKWAYVYVGLYGYSYIESGKRVIGLFKSRGWQTIIADNLVNRLLGIMSLLIGLLTGCATLFAAFLVEEFESSNHPSVLGIGFVVGFFLGLLLSGIFMGLLSSAVDACIVCYAEAPNELEDSHPAIAEEMSRTWSEAWGSDMRGPIIVGLDGGPGVV